MFIYCSDWYWVTTYYIWQQGPYFLPLWKCLFLKMRLSRQSSHLVLFYTRTHERCIIRLSGVTQKRMSSLLSLLPLKDSLSCCLRDFFSPLFSQLPLGCSLQIYIQTSLKLSMVNKYNWAWTLNIIKERVKLTKPSLHALERLDKSLQKVRWVSGWMIKLNVILNGFPFCRTTLFT